MRARKERSELLVATQVRDSRLERPSLGTVAASNMSFAEEVHFKFLSEVKERSGSAGLGLFGLVT